MKNLFTLLAFTVLLPASSLAYPHLSPEKCNFSVQPTKKLSNFYYSKNCDEVYVAPPDIGKTWIRRARPNFSLTMCKDRAQDNGVILRYKALIAKLTVHKTERRIAGTLTADEAEEIEGEIKFIWDQIADVVKSWEGIIGLELGIIFDASLSGNGYSELLQKNQGLINRGISFTPVPIVKSWIAYTPVKNNGFQSVAVLKTNIPGVRYNKVQQNGQARFNAAVSGELTLSLAGACPLIDLNKPVDFTAIRNDPNTLVRDGFEANFSYAVPTEASYGYKASIDVRDAFKTVFNRKGRKSEFSTRDIRKELTTGRSSQAFKMTLDTRYLQGLSNSELLKFENLIRQEVAQNLADKLLERFTAEGLIKVTKVEQLEIPKPGTVDYVRYKEHCWNDWGMFGVRKTRKCETKSYKITHKVAGRLAQVYNRTDLRNFHLEEEFDAKRVVKILHTGTFDN